MYTRKQYNAMVLYLQRRERYNRLLLLGDDIPDNLVSERKILRALLALEDDMPSVRGVLYDYGTLIEQSQQGANRLSVYKIA